MENRRSTRFKFRLPLSVTLSGPERVNHSGYTKNISSGGVLFTSGREPKLRAVIEYVVTISRDAQPVSLRCFGTVLRCDPLPADEPPGFEVAATLERYIFVRGHPAAPGEAECSVNVDPSPGHLSSIVRKRMW